MRQRARVLSTSGRSALVQVVNPGSACGNCKGCVRFTGDRKRKEDTLEVSNPHDAQVGDWVIVENRAADLAKTSLVLYGTPVLGLFFGYTVAYFVSNSDEIAAIGALLGLTLFAVLTRPIASRLAPAIQEPTIVATACSEDNGVQDAPSCCH